MVMPPPLATYAIIVPWRTYRKLLLPYLLMQEQPMFGIRTPGPQTTRRLPPVCSTILCHTQVNIVCVLATGLVSLSPVSINSTFGANDYILRLTDVLYVPQLCHNLISVKRICHDNFCSVEFDGSSFVVKDRPTGTELLQQQNEGAQYRLPLMTGSLKTALATVIDWHLRLCHPHSNVVRKLDQLHCLPHVLNKTDQHYCNCCALGKSRRLPFTVSTSRATEPFHLLHADVWKSPIESNSGFNYFVLFIDDHTHYAWLYLLRRKSEVFDRFIHLHAEITTQFSASVRALQCDGGGEFVNDSMRTFRSDHGILLCIACLYTPQQNGIFERRHQHLANLSRTILAQSGLPTKFWADAVSTANFVVNRLSSSAINYDVPY
ncbi:hypothetical protein MLD38_009926 [Melastoma candidum]|uniref:Uncharacterized protein n=1 Tax=Melastoma candidum TaxID=119954 RepID=A0ACB9QZH4_9MYRT|nr:hypothetical protein MLD38_009926 [Melastoma candidum]